MCIPIHIGTPDDEAYKFIYASRSANYDRSMVMTATGQNLNQGTMS